MRYPLKKQDIKLNAEIIRQAQEMIETLKTKDCTEDVIADQEEIIRLYREQNRTRCGRLSQD